MLRTLGRVHHMLLGLQANVITTGTISHGDTARVLTR